MKITFIGTGEACDKERRNTSLFVEMEQKGFLLDCGFNVVKGLFEMKSPPPLHAVWISHFHGDHFFGLPQLIVHFFQEKRRQQLIICSGPGGAEKIRAVIDLAYPGLLNKLSFPLEFVEMEPESAVELGSLTWQCVPVSHSQSAFAVKIGSQDFSIYYSGDGKPTLQAVKLIKQCDLVVHEAFSMTPSMPSHCSVEECLLLAEELQLKYLALVHMNNATREIFNLGKQEVKIPSSTTLIVPRDGEEFDPP